MPPVINPYDPRKNKLQQTVKQTGQGASAQPQENVTPIASSLPPMPKETTPTQPVGASQVQLKPTQKKDLPISYQQQAAAVVDPRYSQALGQKIQQQVQQQKEVLAKQQEEFQKQINQSDVASFEKVNTLLDKIKTGTATPAEVTEYENLQQVKFKGPTGLEQTTKIAALANLAQSPELLAQQYSGFGARINPAELRQALVPSSRSSVLSQALQSASQLGLAGSEAEKIAKRQAELAQSRAEELKIQAETGVKAEQSKFLQQLQGREKAEIQEKNTALDKLKNAIYLNKKLSNEDLVNIKNKLGITDRDLSEMRALNLGKIEGFTDIESVSDLDKKIKDLKASSEVLTPEQRELISYYENLESNLKRSSDVSSEYSAASANEIAKINALRKLTGQSELTEEEKNKIGKAYEATNITSLPSLIGTMQQGAEQTQDAKNIRDNLDRIMKEMVDKKNVYENVTRFVKKDKDKNKAQYEAEMKKLQNEQDELLKKLEQSSSVFRKWNK